MTPEEREIRAQKLKHSAKLWAQSDEAPSRAEKSKLRHQAHPYHPCISSKGVLSLTLSDCGKYVYISDAIHFVSIINARALISLPHLLKLEADKPGSVSQLLTGESPILEHEARQKRLLKENQISKPATFSLESLGLT